MSGRRQGELVPQGRRRGCQRREQHRRSHFCGIHWTCRCFADRFVNPQRRRHLARGIHVPGCGCVVRVCVRICYLMRSFSHAFDPVDARIRNILLSSAAPSVFESLFGAHIPPYTTLRDRIPYCTISEKPAEVPVGVGNVDSGSDMGILGDRLLFHINQYHPYETTMCLKLSRLTLQCQTHKSTQVILNKHIHATIIHATKTSLILHV